jgi:4-amino-4-deoxy-L-arabinose transferase-like glycosyltransferase
MRLSREAWCVLLLAFVVRAGYLLSAGTPQQLHGDALQYHTYAQTLLEQGRLEGPAGERAARTPGYPFFLAAIYAVTGPSPAVACWAQAALGALTCLLLFWLAQRILAPPWPLICGLASAGYYNLVYPTGTILSETLLSFLLVAALLAVYRQESSAWRRAGSFGVLLGLAYWVRPEALFYGVAGALLLPKVFRSMDQRHSVAALAGLVLCAALWTGRNYVVLRSFVPSSTLGGFVLYQGLRLPLDRDPNYVGEFVRIPESVPELQRDELYKSAFAQLRSSTGFLRTAKAYAFNVLSMYYPFLPQFDATYFFFVPFWLYALWIARRKPEYWLPALPVIISTLLFSFAGGPVSRYRFGIAPLLVLLGVCGLAEWRKRTTRRRFYRGVGIWGSLNLVVWFGATQMRQGVLWLRGALWR